MGANKLNMMVCPHDTAKNPEKWFRFVQYLNHHLTVPVHLSVSLDFKDFHEHFRAADIVYANPTDAIALITGQAFQPLVHPKNLYDEVVFIAHPEVENPTLQSYQGQPVATVDQAAATHLALLLLKQKDIHPSNLVYKDSWIGVVNAIAKQEVAFGFIYKDTYDSLSPKTKALVNGFSTSAAKSVFHGIYLNPIAQTYHQLLAEILTTMHQDDVGNTVLQELQIEGWEVIDPHDLNVLRTIEPALV